MSSFRTHFFTQLLNTDNHENLVKIIKTTYLRNENRINNKKRMINNLTLQKNIYIINYQYH